MTDLGVGDSELVTLTVQPADGDTAATLAVTAPDGTSMAVPVTGGVLEPVADTSPAENRQTWTSIDPVTYTAAGRWVLTWTVTGTGEGAEDVEVWVVASPTAGGPTWTPGRSRVAAYVPHRTLARSMASTVESEDEYALTFDQTTTPSGLMVSRLIADGVAYVSSRLAPVHASSESAAAVLAAIYAAAAVERGWPNDDQSLQRANDLEKRLDLMLRDLAKANQDANTEDGTTYPSVVQPYWSFPPPDLRYDDPRYW